MLVLTQTQTQTQTQAEAEAQAQAKAQTHVWQQLVRTQHLIHVVHSNCLVYVKRVKEVLESDREANVATKKGKTKEQLKN